MNTKKKAETLVNNKQSPYINGHEEYDSDYMGPRKPYMREDRSTSPPNYDPLFRRDRHKSIGIQETRASVALPKINQKLVQKPAKNKSQSKYKKNFHKKYPQLFKGVKVRGGGRKSKRGKLMTVVYKPWVPNSRKYQFFDEIAHKYKVY